MHIHMFDQRLLDLQAEIHAHHPGLVELCSHQPDKDFYIQLCEVAGFVGVIIDGDYNDQDIYGLCEYLTKQLVKARTVLVVSDNQ